MNAVMLGIGAGALAVGALLVWVGLLVRKNHERKRQTWRRGYATVVDVKSRGDAWHWVMEYTDTQERVHRRVNTFGSSFERRRDIPFPIEVLVHPENPATFIPESGRTAMFPAILAWSFALVMIVIGATFVTVGVLV